MKATLQAVLVSCLFLGNPAQAQFPTIYDAANAVLRFLETNKIGVMDGENSPLPYFTVNPSTVQILAWALASGMSLGTGLTKKTVDSSNWLLSGENGAPGFYFIDSRKIKHRVTDDGRLVEFFFENDRHHPLKIWESKANEICPFFNVLERARANGGGFVRIRLEQGAKCDELCVWKTEHPKRDGFDPNAWNDGPSGSVTALDARPFNDLFLIDPRQYESTVRFHRTKRKTSKGEAEYWVGAKFFVVTAWQKKLIRSLEDEARRRQMAIACSKSLLKNDLKQTPWTANELCFVVDPTLLPGGGTRTDIFEFLDSSDDVAREDNVLLTSPLVSYDTL